MSVALSFKAFNSVRNVNLSRHASIQEHKVLILCRRKVTTDSMGADQLAGTAWTIKGTDLILGNGQLMVPQMTNVHDPTKVLTNPTHCSIQSTQ